MADNNRDVRQDTVAYIPFEERDDEGTTALGFAASLLEQVGAELNARLASEGKLPQLLRPEFYMLAEYQKAAAYRPHRDSVLEEGGWVNPRIITAIMYLQSAWSPSSGGALRCFPGANEDDNDGKTCRQPRDVHHFVCQKLADTAA